MRILTILALVSSIALLIGGGCNRDRQLTNPNLYDLAIPDFAPPSDFAMVMDLVPPADLKVLRDLARLPPDLNLAGCEIVAIDENIVARTCCQHVRCSPGCACSPFGWQYNLDGGAVEVCVPVPPKDVNCVPLGGACQGGVVPGTNNCCQRQDVYQYPGGAYCNGHCNGDVGPTLVDPNDWKRVCQFYGR